VRFGLGLHPGVKKTILLVKIVGRIGRHWQDKAAVGRIGWQLAGKGGSWQDMAAVGRIRPYPDVGGHRTTSHPK